MQKENLKKAIDPSREVALKFSVSKTKGNNIIVRVKKDNLVKRYMNRLFERKGELMPSFCEKLGVPAAEGEVVVPFSKIAEAAEIFPPVEKFAA